MDCEFVMASQDMEETLEARSWSGLPIELLYLILSYIPYSYHPYFALVCMRWKLCTSPVYPADVCPLLAYHNQWGDGIFHYYSPSLRKTFIVDCPIDLSGTIFYFAKDGWLALYRPTEIILANPITGIVHKTPDIDDFYQFDGVAFSGTPPHDCMVFAIASAFSSFVEINTANCGKDQFYLEARYANNMPFVMSGNCNPVYFCGLFYCLGKDGNLGVYNPVDYTWTILDKPKLVSKPGEEAFLVESEGVLLAVLIGKHGISLCVFKLNQMKMEWEHVKSIGERTLFVGSRASLCSSTCGSIMKDKVYVPRLHGKSEIIHAEAKCSGGRVFFIPRTSLCEDLKGDLGRTNEASMCYYSLANGEHSEYFEFVEKLCSIWFEPRIDRC